MATRTIATLNGRAWYRLLKVVYVVVFLCILFVFNTIIAQEMQTLDTEQTKIRCNYKSRRVFTPKDAGVFLSGYDLKGGFNYKAFFERGYHLYEISNILNACYKFEDKSADVFLIQRYNEMQPPDATTSPALTNAQSEELKRMGNEFSDRTKAAYLDYSVELFTIQPVFTYNAYIKNFLLGNGVIIAFFFILRALFHYVVLGQFISRRK